MGWYPAATKIVVLEVSEAPAGENNGNETRNETRGVGTGQATFYIDRGPPPSLSLTHKRLDPIKVLLPAT
jgi:hypothetical protein